MYQDDTIARTVQDIRYAGANPLLQFDILDSGMLRQKVCEQFPGVSAVALARVLRYLEMRPIGLHSILGIPSTLWTCYPYGPLDGMLNMVRHRAKTNATELHMELKAHEYQPFGPIERIPRLPTFEREVLSLRLQAQGLRYPRPSEMAEKLECATFQVNRALQTIRRVLHLSTLKDMAAARRAVRESGVLMDDPAFY